VTLALCLKLRVVSQRRHWPTSFQRHVTSNSLIDRYHGITVWNYQLWGVFHLVLLLWSYHSISPSGNRGQQRDQLKYVGFKDNATFVRVGEWGEEKDWIDAHVQWFSTQILRLSRKYTNYHGGSWYSNKALFTSYGTVLPSLEQENVTGTKWHIDYQHPTSDMIKKFTSLNWGCWNCIFQARYIF